LRRRPTTRPVRRSHQLPARDIAALMCFAALISNAFIPSDSASRFAASTSR
jgi:hypothetical protein